MSDNFGTIGDLNKYRGANKPTGLPQWLLDQVSANTTVDEGGGQKTEYSFNDNPLGGFRRNGKTYVQVGQNKLKDPSKFTTDPELGDITETGNVNDLKPQGINYAMLAAALGVGALGTMAGVGAAGAEGAAGAAGAGEAAGAGLTPLTGVTLAPETTIGTMGTYGGAAGAAGGAAGAAGGGGGLASLGATGGEAGAGLTPLTGVTLAPETSIGSLTQATSPSLLSQAGNYLTSNPGQAARLGLGLAALGGAASGAKPASGGAGTDTGSIIDQMANANRVNQNTPLGSRAWVHNQDGTWTVNDTLNPNEQANFENVQGMNSGVTDYAKQALARLLAAPPAQRADRPFTVNGHTIGG